MRFDSQAHVAKALTIETGYAGGISASLVQGNLADTTSDFMYIGGSVSLQNTNNSWHLAIYKINFETMETNIFTIVYEGATDGSTCDIDDGWLNPSTAKYISHLGF